MPNNTCVDCENGEALYIDPRLPPLDNGKMKTYTKTTAQWRVANRNELHFL